MGQGIKDPKPGKPAPRGHKHKAGAESLEGQVPSPETGARGNSWTRKGAYPKTQIPGQTEGATPRSTSSDWEGDVKPGPTERQTTPRKTQRDSQVTSFPR